MINFKLYNNISSNLGHVGLAIISSTLMVSGTHKIIKSNMLNFTPFRKQLTKSRNVNKKLALISTLMFLSGTILFILEITNIYNRIINYNNNICFIKKDLCENNLGISRKDMPQLEGDIKSFFLSKLDVSKVNFYARSLTAIQNEADWSKIQSMMNAAKSGSWNPCNDSRIITAGAINLPHILDGHHRAFACALQNGIISAWHINEPPILAIKLANAFPGVQHHASGHFNV